MKKLLLSFLTLPILTLGQTTVDFVVMESSTGTWCGACPAVAEIFHNFDANGDDVALIKYHFNDSYANAASSGRNNYYNVGWYPQAMIGGDTVGYDNWATESHFQSMYASKKSETAPFSINLTATQSGGDITISGEVEEVDTYSSSNLKLRIVITESNIQEAWQGETELHNVCREMLPNHNGASLDFSSSSTHAFNETFTPDNSWDWSNLEIIAFVQDDANKDILQGYKASLSAALNVEIITQNPIRIYPNPAKDFITIEAKGIENIVFSNAIGQVINTKVNKSDYSYKTMAMPSNLDPGIYFASIELENGTRVKESIIIK